MSRRKFLKNLGALGAGTVISPLAAQPHSSSSLSPKKNSPVVISTWIHGMEANAGRGKSWVPQAMPSTQFKKV